MHMYMYMYKGGKRGVKIFAAARAHTSRTVNASLLKDKVSLEVRICVITDLMVIQVLGDEVDMRVPDFILPA